MRSRVLTSVVLAVPGLGLGAAGLLHPHRLVPETADQWYWVHVGGLAFFPLLAVALVVLVRGRVDPLAWLVRVGAFGFAVLYTALDVVYGVAAGRVTREMGEGYERSADLSAMLRVAVDLGELGSLSLIAAAVVLLVDTAVRHGLLAVAVVPVLVGAWLIHQDHIFSPQGALGAALVGVATGVLAWNLPGTRRVEGATSPAPSAS